MEKVLITGNQRSGTTLLQIVSKSFENCLTIDIERNPYVPLNKLEKSSKLLIRKCPQGQLISQQDRWLGDFLDNDGNIRTLSDVIDNGWKIIYIYRDARDVLVSKHGNNLSIYWAKTWQWISSIKSFISNMDNDQIIPIKYENFVSNHEKLIHELASFCGTKAGDYNSSHRLILPNGQAHKAVRQLRPIDTNSIGLWKKEEHKDRIKEIIQEGGEELCNLLIELVYEENNKWTKDYEY